MIKMINYQNKDFRKKNLRGAKIEDLYIFLETVKGDKKNAKLAKEIQKFIENEFDYEPVFKQMAK